MEDLSSEILTIAEYAFEYYPYQEHDKFINKYKKILPIISMINKKDYDSLNKYCDNIQIDKDMNIPQLSISGHNCRFDIQGETMVNKIEKTSNAFPGA